MQPRCPSSTTEHLVAEFHAATLLIAVSQDRRVAVLRSAGNARRDLVGGRSRRRQRWREAPVRGALRVLRRLRAGRLPARFARRGACRARHDQRRLQPTDASCPVRSSRRPRRTVDRRRRRPGARAERRDGRGATGQSGHQVGPELRRGSGASRRDGAGRRHIRRRSTPIPAITPALRHWSPSLLRRAERVRASTRACASAGGLRIVGAERLRALELPARDARRLVIYGHASGASGWSFEYSDSRLVFILSPEPSRGLSGEGALLEDTSSEDAGADARLLAALRWNARITTSELARELEIEPASAAGGLARLAAAGLVGYDLAESSYFYRALPVTRSDAAGAARG